MKSPKQTVVMLHKSASFVSLLVLLLALASGLHPLWAQVAVSQAEHDRMEREIQGRIETYESWIASDTKAIESWEYDLTYAADHGMRSRIADIHKGLAEAKERLRQHQAKLAELQVQLRNLPAVRDERAQQEQQDRIERQRAEVQDFLDRQNQKRQEQFKRDASMLNAIGQGLKSLADDWAKGKQSESDSESDAVPSPTPKRRVVEVPNLVVPAEPRPKSFVVGNLDELMKPEPAPPPPAKPLFDSPLAQFLVDVAKETGRTLTKSTIDTWYLNREFDEHPFKHGLEEKLGELGGLMLDLLPEKSQQEIRTAIEIATGDYYATTLALLPADKQFEVRAGRLPLSIIKGDYDKALGDLWDKEVMPRMEAISPSFSSSPPSESSKYYEKLAEAGLDLLRDRDGEQTGESQLRIRRDPDTIGMPKVIGSTPEQGWRDYRTARDAWNRNKSRVWKSVVPDAQSEAEADFIMRKAFESRERDLQTKDRLIKEQEQP